MFLEYQQAMSYNYYLSHIKRCVLRSSTISPLAFFHFIFSFQFALINNLIVLGGKKMDDEDRLAIWLNRNIGRVDAERGLAGQRDGVFLVRTSVSAPGDYVISVVFSGVVQHHQVRFFFSFILFSD